MQLSDVDYRDIQGLVRFGHGHMTEASFHLVEIADVEAARVWLANAPVTTAVESGTLPKRALQVAFKYEGLRKLGLPESVLEGFSAEFRGGMVEANRSRRLGDVNANDPANWRWGAPGQPQPHILLMLYAIAGGLAGWEQEVKGKNWNAIFTSIYRLSTVRLVDTEPFGFVDGISQPELDWLREKPTKLRTTTKYTNISALGEFPLLEPHEDPSGVLPLAEDAPGKKDLGRNGTYLVLRDLEQDVRGFKRFVEEQANHDAHARRALAGAMTGRMPVDVPVIPSGYSIIPADDPTWVLPPGSPVARLSEDNLDGIGPELKDVWLNQFTFKNDLDGIACPYGAHIRRANPRNADLPDDTGSWIGRFLRTLGFASAHPHDDVLASTRFHRLLRRARKYVSGGQGDAKETGLRFICLNANIARQFEFIQTSWLVNPKFNGLNEDDPLVGNRAPLLGGEAVNAFTCPLDSGLLSRTFGLKQFVTVRGGGYFFMPGLSALRFIVQKFN
jgi:deferrochelatase/peroxidase EfeB